MDWFSPVTSGKRQRFHTSPRSTPTLSCAFCASSWPLTDQVRCRATEALGCDSSRESSAATAAATRIGPLRSRVANVSSFTPRHDRLPPSPAPFCASSRPLTQLDRKQRPGIFRGRPFPPNLRRSLPPRPRPAAQPTFTLAKVSLRARAEAWRACSSFGQSSTSTCASAPARPTTVGTLIAVPRRP